MPQQNKTGYLLEDFRIFYNADRNMRTIPLHYHDFHKIVILLSGHVSYMIEGRTFDLLPGDLVLVRAGAMHQPVIHDSTLYERIIIYIAPDFSCSDLSGRPGGSEESVTAAALFKKALPGFELIRPGGQDAQELGSIFSSLKRSSLEKDPQRQVFAQLYRRIKTIELMILLLRLLSRDLSASPRTSSASPMAADIMSYISRNLTDPALCVDRIAEANNLNRSYLMHYFKEQTGYTIGNYITEKRLFIARSLISQGTSMTQACYECGFGSYSAFYRAYRKKYGLSPKERNPGRRTLAASDHAE